MATLRAYAGPAFTPAAGCEAYIAEPPAMAGDIVWVLARAGLPRQRIHYDDALLADAGSHNGGTRS